MANKIKGITIEIGGDTTGLDRALKGVDSETKALQSELTQVNKQLKFDPTNTELLAQKQKILAKSIDDTKNKLSTLKEAEKQAQEQFKDGKISEEQYRALQREIIATETKLKGLETQAKNSNATLLKIDAVGTKFQNVGSKIESVGKKLSIVSAGAGLLLGGLIKTGIEAGKSADDINTLSKQTGLSTEQIQVFNYATDIVDVSIETLTKSMAKLTKNMASAQNGSKNTQEAFKALGVEYLDSSGNLRNNQDVFDDTVNALRKMDNETQRDAYAMQIFGKSAQDLNPLILDTNNTLKSMGEEAKKSGLILSQDALDGANEFNDALDTLKATAKASFSKLGTTMAKVLMPVVKELSESLKNFLEFLSSLDEETLKNITRILAITAVIGPLIVLIGKLNTGVGSLIKSTKSLYTAILAHPYVALAVAIGTVAVALYAVAEKQEYFTDKQKEAIKSAKDNIQKQKELANELEKSKQAYKETADGIIVNAEKAELLKDKIFELQKSEEDSNLKKEKMKALVAELNGLMPELNLQYDAERGKLSLTNDEITKQIDNYKKLAYTKASETRLQELAKEQIDIEINQKDLLKNRIALQNELSEAYKKYGSIKKSDYATESEWSKAVYAQSNVINELRHNLDNVNSSIDTNNAKLKNSKDEFNSTADTAKELSTMTADEINKKLEETAGKFGEAGKNAGENFESGLLGQQGKIQADVSTFAHGVANQFQKINWSKIGTEASNGIWYGFASGMAVVDKNLAKKLKQTETIAKKTWDIHSPSHLFEKEVGKMGAMGIGIGFENEMDNTNAKIQKSLQQDFSMNSKLNLNPKSSAEISQQQNNLSLSNALSQLQNLSTNNSGQEINVNVVLQADTDSFVRFITPKINIENEKIGTKGAVAV